VGRNWVRFGIFGSSQFSLSIFNKYQYDINMLGKCHKCGAPRRLGAASCRRCGAILDPGAAYLRVIGLLTLAFLILIALTV